MKHECIKHSIFYEQYFDVFIEADPTLLGLVGITFFAPNTQYDVLLNSPKLSLMMASAQVVETSVNTNNSPSQDYTTNPDDHSNHNKTVSIVSLQTGWETFVFYLG